jgi:deoxyribonuclease V
MLLDKSKLNLNWPLDKDRAKLVQESLRKEVRITPLKSEPGLVAGVDAAFFDDKVIGAACLFTYPGLELIEETYCIKEAGFPYIPGFLSFREGPAVIAAIERLKATPDLVIFDGQGIAHPNGLGIASYAGVLLDMPAIGCAKSRLVGTFREPGQKRGSRTALKYNGKTVGAVLRTRESTRPLFVSPGHRVDVDDSIRIVLGCASGYRITEPVRCADLLTKKLKQRFE